MALTTQEMVKIALDLVGYDELPIDSQLTVPGENITKVLAGIDMGTAEIMLAKQLGYDCVFRHHNLTSRMGRLGELVCEDHYKKMVKNGVPVNVAQKVMACRKQEVEIMFHGNNFEGAGQTAKLLNMPFVGLHTPADLLGERTVEAKIAEVYAAKENPTVGDLFDAIMTIREFKEAPDGQRPVIWVGDRDSYAGKAVVEFSGGLAPEWEEVKAYIDAGVGTFVSMHMDNGIVKKLREDNRANAIICGHMASDSIGMNIILEAWKQAGGIEYTCIGGMV